MARALVLSGGFTKDHDFATTESLLTLLGAVGLDCETETDVEAGLARLGSDGGVDLVVTNVLRWSMGAEAYAPYRQEFAFSPSAGARAEMRAHLGRGGGLLALHTSVISFDDWPEWGGLLGGQWVWGRSTHPPVQPLEIEVAAGTGPLPVEPGRFEVVDELYHGLELAADADVLAWGRAGDLRAPVVWVRREGPGRVCTDVLGHDRRSYASPSHAAIVRAAAGWAAAR